ncbi:MAG: RidA family protein [Gemmatimonas sp.]|nr:RidA family protein [Gemmatimonas sp.]
MEKLRIAIGIAMVGALSVVSLQAQDRDAVRFIGGTEPDATLAQAVIVDNTIYLSGALGTRAGPTIEDQTRAVMESIRDRLAELGATMDDVVKCTVFMADLSERPQLNEVYRSFFPTNKPARSAVGVDLGGPKVEIECIAVASD